MSRWKMEIKAISSAEAMLKTRLVSLVSLDPVSTEIPQMHVPFYFLMELFYLKTVA
jgi:hypothetical protein